MFSGEERSLDKNTIQDLPDEILLAIFSYLEISDVRNVVSNVCVQWSNLAKDKKLWKHLFFRTTNKTTKTFGTNSWFSTLRFLKTTPEVQNVIVSQGHSREEISEILKLLNKHCLELKYLKFEEDLGFLGRHFRRLSNIFEKVESLEVNLGPCQFGVFKTLSQFTNLKSLTFLGTEPDPTGFGNFLRSFPSINTIDASNIDFSKTNFMSLWKLKDQFTSLSLRLDKLDENCLKLLGLFPKLTSVSLTDRCAYPNKLFRIGNIKCLTYLNLGEVDASPVLSATALSEFLQTGWFLNLKELRLYNSRLNDDGAVEIRRNCPNLVYLEVTTYKKSLSNLTERALLHFLHCYRLKHLEILFDTSDESDWIYRRIRHVHHDCDIDEICPVGLEELLTSWDEILIPID